MDCMGVGEVTPGRAGDEARTRRKVEGQVSTAMDRVLIAGSHWEMGRGGTVRGGAEPG